MSGSVAETSPVAMTVLERHTQPAVLITEEQMKLAKETVAKDATDSEFALFVYDCRRRGVHPLDRLIHFTKRGGKYTPVTSIDMFRSRAASSREHVGTDDAVYTSTPDAAEFAATVTVYRLVHGERCPFTATARMAEYMPEPPNDFMWKKMPHGQLGKCAEALALRKGFPQELDGLYTFEEMEQAGGRDEEAGSGRQSIQAPQRKSAQKSVGSSSTSRRGGNAPELQTTEPVHITKVHQPDGKKFYRLEVKGDQRFFTAWPGDDDDAIVAASKFADGAALAVIHFFEKKAGDKSYFNVKKVEAAPEAKAEEREPGTDDDTPNPTADDIFGAKK